MRMKLRPVLAGLLLAGLMLAGPPATTALARGGVWIGIGPAYPAYPYPYPYPAYPYAPVPYGPVPAPYPPPAYYEAPPAVAGRLGQACYAGPYMCQLGQPGYVGQACSCPARPGERAWGQVGD